MNWHNKITEKQTADFGLVVILILAILAFWQKDTDLIIGIIAVGLIIIIVPVVLSPFAYMWFEFARILSVFSSTILLGTLFFILITPTAVIRKILGKDTLNLRKFKKSRKSVLINRDHQYGIDDLTKTF